MGDFNINLLNCDNHMETHDYIDAMFSTSFLHQITKNYSNDILGEHNLLLIYY